MQKYFEAPKPKLIYVFRILDNAHKGCLKVGETTLDVDDTINPFTLQPNASVLNKCARKRIDQYTQTAGISYELLYTECTLHMNGMKIGWFNDKDVHEVLTRSGIKRKEFEYAGNKSREWFITDLETVKNAITAVKEGRQSLNPGEITIDRSPIEFRPEQSRAIEKAVTRFGRNNKMLWNAKMRFGKTLCALEVAKRMQFGRTLILTHRPVVDAGWFEDFDKIFYDRPNYAYGSKNHGSSFANLEGRRIKEGLNYVYFASMQDLRGSERVGGKFDKNDDIFKTEWDYIIIDEAHEGTQTALGKAVITELTKPGTKVLQLSGTPFNLMDEVSEEEIYTWDYTMEQRAKQEWDRNHFGDPNPYASLPRMNIYTYDLGRLLHNNEFNDEEIAFNFREFFRTNPDGEFIHREDVLRFLNLLTKPDANSMYPFANDRYRNIFRHTLWMLPGVKEAKALSALLKEHPVFGNFDIVNVAGDGDEEEEHEEALRKVNKAIEESQYGTITLSCGRLTTGVSVKQWMGVLMLSGSYNTAASSYMQTIFRVQTPYTRDGLVKEDCYVFDFAPDRTLQVLATVPRVSTKAGKTTEAQKRALGDFLNFCPVIGMEGSVMKPYDANKMMEQLKKAYVERVVRNGFEDGYLYNDELLKLDDVALKDFDDLKGIIGQTKAIGNAGNIDVNVQGLTNEEYKEKERLEKKKKRELTPEEKARLEELKKKKKVRQDAISILRGISIRMPLLIYGAKIENEEEELTIDNFTTLVDARSWEEFMPRGVTKATFNKFKKYYDPDIFAAAGKRIRAMARAADRLTIEERIERITDIFSTFRNPDKETVLTPWRVVNMHMSDTLGGYTFYNEDFTETLREPRYVDRHRITDEVFATDSHLLEINSKSGLYPLYLAYNLYRLAVKEEMFSPQTLDEHQRIWDKVVTNNLFVICKTPMAKAITRRTLLGFRKGKSNMWAPEDLINKIKNQPELFIKKVHDLIGKNVKINAIVGNPPYQENLDASRSLAKQLFPTFIEIGIKLSPKYFSLITPARWFTADAQDNSFPKLRDFAKKNNHFTLIATHNGKKLFPNTELSMVDYFLWDKEYDGNVRFIEYINGNTNTLSRPLFEEGLDIIIPQNNIVSIIRKIKDSDFIPLNSITTGRDAFGIVGKDFENKSKAQKFEDSISVQCAYEQIRYIPRSSVLKGLDFVDCFKIFTSKGNGGAGLLTDGKPVAIIGKAFIGTPGMACTDSLIPFGKFSTYKEAENLQKYMSSKFLRFCVGILKVSQNLYQNVYSFVPLQDFTEKSDIDWSKSVEEIDKQLYAKYGLSEQEVAFIESMIKPMS